MTDREARVVLGIIGGSGLGNALVDDAGAGGDEVEVDTPFGPPASTIVKTTWHGTPVFLLQRHGPGHVFNPTAVPYRANVFALKALGVTHVLASGAVGSLRPHLNPGQLVVCDQLIDRTRQRASTFYEHAAVHVEFAEPFCPVMRKWLLDAAQRTTVGGLNDTVVHDGGTYVCMEGPAFSTRAESEVHRRLGGDLIGMTACPEAKLAREAELAYALIAMPTDYDGKQPDAENASPDSLLEEIIGNLRHATAANLALIKQALSDVSVLRGQPSPAHDALRLGVWSDKSRIDRTEVERLGVLWGRHFERV